MTGPTIRVAAGDTLPAPLPPGVTLVLAPGTHSGRLFVEHDLTVRGEAGAVLNAGGRGSVVAVIGDQIQVDLTDVILSGGRADLGGGVYVEGRAQVTLRGCTLRDNIDRAGGGAIGARRGQLNLHGCTVEGDVRLTQVCRAWLRDTMIDGDLVLREAVRVEMEGGSIEGVLDVRGTTTRAPDVSWSGTDIAEVANDPKLPGTLTDRSH